MKVLSWLLKHWAPIVLGLGALAFINYRWQADQMHVRARFTIGLLDDWHYTAKSGRFFNYHFAVRGVPYEGSSSRQAHMNEAKGTRYLVEYDSLAPAQNVGHFDIAIPDSIRQAPANGWGKPPFPLPAWMVDHGNSGQPINTRR